jgi:hypothetical protein
LPSSSGFCKTLYSGSIPLAASNESPGQDLCSAATMLTPDPKLCATWASVSALADQSGTGTGALPVLAFLSSDRWN